MLTRMHNYVATLETVYVGCSIHACTRMEVTKLLSDSSDCYRIMLPLERQLPRSPFHFKMRVKKLA